jgi:hypothetical protein
VLVDYAPAPAVTNRALVSSKSRTISEASAA